MHVVLTLQILELLMMKIKNTFTLRYNSIITKLHIINKMCYERAKKKRCLWYEI